MISSKVYCSGISLIWCAIVAVALACSAASASDWADNLIGSDRLGYNPYNDPYSVLGKPTTLIWELGYDPQVPQGTYRCSMGYGAWNTAPDGSKLIATILDGGYITVEFSEPIYHDPLNWDGKDFIVFGNAIFGLIGKVRLDTNMEACKIKNGYEGNWEPMTVSVSQDNVTWYTYTNGPYADDYAPTHSFAWDWVEDTWGPELDFTKPVPGSWARTDFGDKFVAEGIDIYRGSAGGTAFNLDDLDLPTAPATGRKWARYIKVTSDRLDADNLPIWGEVDAFARVGHKIEPVSIGDAKNLTDGTRVVLKETIVTAATYEAGCCCWVEHGDRSGGIKVMGRVLKRGDRITIYGEMGTVDGERVVRSTAIDPPQGGEPLPTGEVKPVGMPARSFESISAGLLTRTWGRVKSVDTTSKEFTIDDGSGRTIRCVAPRKVPGALDPPNPSDPTWGTAPDPGFVPPAQEAYVAVTGISSPEPALRLRSRDDLTPIQ